MDLVEHRGGEILLTLFTNYLNQFDPTIRTIKGSGSAERVQKSFLLITLLNT